EVRALLAAHPAVQRDDPRRDAPRDPADLRGRARRMTLTGSCLCGRVRYEIDGKLGPVVHCHCVSCRKAQGGAFTSGAPGRLKYFRLRSGADAVAEFESSPGKRRCFCRSCGAPLWSRRDAEPDSLRIRLGLLDDDPGRRPLGHVWVGEKAPWYEIADDLPRAEDGDLEAKLRTAASRPVE